ncbi:MAG: hypothetical protein C4331_18675 [Meiothermus sp.]
MPMNTLIREGVLPATGLHHCRRQHLEVRLQLLEGLAELVKFSFEPSFFAQKLGVKRAFRKQHLIDLLGLRGEFALTVLLEVILLRVAVVLADGVEIGGQLEADHRTLALEDFRVVPLFLAQHSVFPTPGDVPRVALIARHRTVSGNRHPEAR